MNEKLRRCQDCIGAQEAVNQTPVCFLDEASASIATGLNDGSLTIAKASEKISRVSQQAVRRSCPRSEVENFRGHFGKIKPMLPHFSLTSVPRDAAEIYCLERALHNNTKPDTGRRAH